MLQCNPYKPIRGFILFIRSIPLSVLIDLCRYNYKVSQHQKQDGIPPRLFIPVKLNRIFNHIAVLGLMAIQSFSWGISWTASTNFWQCGRGLRRSGMAAAHDVR